ncbi:TetR/AcrR family transcriptional regulator [Zavarzinia compransoris]|nr:TetR/AcrR family transcriptional regulator [Zavarzinia compransoris]TDP43657.1 TetR family transcriptional regulator [Zavarzinia compransoris]
MGKEQAARKAIVRGEGETRQRILQAALRHFAAASFDEASLRDIAGDVGVDVAYVHRCFGSKEGLFREVLDAADETVNLAGLGPEMLTETLARLIFEQPSVPLAAEVDPFLIFVHSLASQKAGGLVGERMERNFLDPIRHGFGHPGAFQATMIGSLLIGLGLLRNLLRLPAATGIDDAAAEAMIRDAIRALAALKAPADPAAAD